MNFKKLAVAGALAVAGFGAAGSASAAIASTSTNNGEIFFTIWDDATKSSYTLDTGIRINTFYESLNATGVNSANPYTLTFAADSTFTSWLSGKDFSTLQWNVFGGDSSGTNGSNVLTGKDLATGLSYAQGGNRHLLTSNDDLTYEINSVIKGMNTGVIDALNQYGYENATIATNGSTVTYYSIDPVSYTGNTTWGCDMGGNLSGQQCYTGAGSFDYWSMTTSSTEPSDYVSTFKIGAWTLAADGTLSGSFYTTAVPEPSSVLLMLAGLLSLGAVARRRLK